MTCPAALARPPHSFSLNISPRRLATAGMDAIAKSHTPSPSLARAQTSSRNATMPHPSLESLYSSSHTTHHPTRPMDGPSSCADTCPAEVGRAGIFRVRPGCSPMQELAVQRVRRRLCCTSCCVWQQSRGPTNGETKFLGQTSRQPTDLYYYIPYAHEANPNRDFDRLWLDTRSFAFIHSSRRGCIGRRTGGRDWLDSPACPVISARSTAGR